MTTAPARNLNARSKAGAACGIALAAAAGAAAFALNPFVPSFLLPGAVYRAPPARLTASVAAPLAKSEASAAVALLAPPPAPPPAPAPAAAAKRGIAVTALPPLGQTGRSIIPPYRPPPAPRGALPLDTEALATR